MKIGFFSVGIGPFAQPDLIKEVAVNAERLGFATIWASEHVVLFERFASQYPYARGEDLPVALDIPFMNPFIALTYAAAHTTSIRLATGICLVPQYHPLMLAKIVGSLDCLSKGRVALGIGVGWLAEEFQALGIPWERRSQRTREYVDAMREVWGKERSTYRGEFVQFEEVICYPKPVRRAQLPVWAGGHSEAALKRAAEYCNGWCGLNLTLDETRKAIARLRQLLKENGRDEENFEYLVSPVATTTPADLPRYRDAGVDELYLTPLFGQTLDSSTGFGSLLEDLARRWVEPAANL
ncbi:MAG: LLM class F420-dependent oxidoreductase [Steroidobacteraceae bacterium]